MTALYVSGEIILFRPGGAFKAASIVGVFSAEEIFAVYKNVDLLGNAADPKIIFIPVTVMTVIISAAFAAKCISASGLAARENAERAYYDEILRTYDETRRIRHDINSHLSALAILLENGNTEEARRYLSEISSEIYARKFPVITGRAVLDALL